MAIPNPAGIRSLAAPFMTGAPPRGFIDGLVTELAADADHDVTVNVGECADSLAGNDQLVAVTAAFTKQIDAAWAEGDAAGGMATGSVAADTEYNLILIEKNGERGNVDMTFDVSATGANAPSGWTARRRIGSVFTDGSANLLAYHQAGDFFFYEEFVRDALDTTGTLGTYYTATVSVPANMVGLFSVFGQVTTGTDIQMALRRTGSSNPTNTGKMSYSAVSSSTATLQFPIVMAVSSAGQVDYTLRSADGTWSQLQLVTMGWIDDRGRNV